MKNGFMKTMVIVLLLVSGVRASDGVGVVADAVRQVQECAQGAVVVGAALVAGAGIAAAVHECVIS
jgi:hypothetical protein